MAIVHPLIERLGRPSVAERCVVFGATGNTGSRVAAGLLAAGKRVRVVGRSAERLKGFVERGGEAVAASAADAAAMRRATSGASSAYVMVPPLDYANPDCDVHLQDIISESLVAAIRDSDVQFVVNLSSLGADRPGMMEQIDSLRRHEERLRAVRGLHVVHLRPGFFMEALLDQVQNVAETGLFAYPLDPSVAIPMISAADVAAEALEHLLALDFRGECAVELAGPRDVTMQEVADVFGRVAGIRDMPYVQIPYDHFRWSLERAGVRKDVIEILVATNRFLNSGRFTPSGCRPRQARRMVAIEEFASTFAERLAEYREPKQVASSLRIRIERGCNEHRR